MIANDAKLSVKSYTCNLMSYFLRFRNNYTKKTVENKKSEKDAGCVSDAMKKARIQMIQETLSRRGFLSGAAAAAGMTAAFGSQASAQDTEVAAHPDPFAMTREEELAELGAADDAATEFAMENPQGVGILLHVGDDLRERAIALAEQHNAPPQAAMEYAIGVVTEHYQSLFAAHGVEAELFPRTNHGASASGITYHIGNLVYEDADGNPLLDLGRANEEVPRVVEALAYLNTQASLDVTPVPGG